MEQFIVGLIILGAVTFLTRQLKQTAKGNTCSGCSTDCQMCKQPDNS